MREGNKWNKLESLEAKGAEEWQRPRGTLKTRKRERMGEEGREGINTFVGE